MGLKETFPTTITSGSASAKTGSLQPISVSQSYMKGMLFSNPLVVSWALQLLLHSPSLSNTSACISTPSAAAISSAGPLLLLWLTPPAQPLLSLHKPPRCGFVFLRGSTLWRRRGHSHKGLLARRTEHPSFPSHSHQHAPPAAAGTAGSRPPTPLAGSFRWAEPELCECQDARPWLPSGSLGSPRMPSPETRGGSSISCCCCCKS